MPAGDEECVGERVGLPVRGVGALSSLRDDRHRHAEETGEEDDLSRDVDDHARETRCLASAILTILRR